MSNKTKIIFSIVLAASIILLCAASISSQKPAKKMLLNIPAERIVAIGDIHGDFDSLEVALIKAGAINEEGHWTGGKMIVVQTGDFLDRGNYEIQIIDFFEKLKKEARAAGGALYTLSGNHELMNIESDFRFVTAAGYSSFVKEKGMTRKEAFQPGGPYAKILATYPVILQLGDILFVHAGVTPAHVRYGFDRINKEVADWMLGYRKRPKYLYSLESPFWYRKYRHKIPRKYCRSLRKALTMTKAKMMVVGHIIYPNINSACEGKIWRLDTGIGTAQHRRYGGKVQVLDIRKDGVRVIR